jgi:hypothetical protein
VSPRLRLSACLIVAALPLAGGPTTAEAPPPDGASSPMTFSNTLPIQINDNGNANPYPSTINVVGLHGTIRAISIRLNNLSHGFPLDIDAVLVGPGGQAFLFMSDVGANVAVSNVTLTFSDDGAGPPPTPLATGTYLPTNNGFNDTFPFPGPGLNYASPAPAGTATFASTFRGAQANGLWRLFIVDAFQQYVGSIAGGWSLTFTTHANAPADFEGDGRTDVAVTRAGSLQWHILNSAGYTGLVWGDHTEDVPVPGDYDGDGRTDVAVWRPSTGTFWVRRSSDLAVLARPWGAAGDDPTVVGDYDGDGRTDFAVYRPGNPSVWWVLRSFTGTFAGTAFGQTGDKPAPGDYDGDGKHDLAVARGPGSSTFFIQQSTAGFAAIPWGLLSDSILAGDYDGDGISDIAVARQVAGAWNHYVRLSSTGGLSGQVWGLATDVLTPGDYDGDGRTDFAVWRPTPAPSAFYALQSSNGALRAQPWGLDVDRPLMFFAVH